MLCGTNQYPNCKSEYGYDDEMGEEDKGKGRERWKRTMKIILRKRVRKDTNDECIMFAGTNTKYIYKMFI